MRQIDRPLTFSRESGKALQGIATATSVVNRSALSGELASRRIIAVHKIEADSNRNSLTDFRQKTRINRHTVSKQNGVADTNARVFMAPFRMTLEAFPYVSIGRDYPAAAGNYNKSEPGRDHISCYNSTAPRPPIR